MSSRSVFAAGPLAALTGFGHLSRRRAQAAEASHPPLGEFVNIEGKRVHFHREGYGPAVILIHGAGGNLRDFTFELAGKMAVDHQVIAFDRPGHGYTDILHRRGESPAEQAHLLHRAARRIGVERAVICGYSFGGAVALAWALDYPEFVEGLLLISAVSHPWPGGVGVLFGSAAHLLTAPVVVPAISALSPEKLVSRTLTSVFRPKSPPKGYLDYIGAGLSLRAHSVLANARQVAGLKRHLSAMAPRYPGITVPVEILHGLEDRSVYASLHAEVMERTMPRATYTPLPRIGHSPHHHSHPEILAALARLDALRGTA
jgi:pimeloyl-ACP methyl ester carboxylesterase